MVSANSRVRVCAAMTITVASDVHGQTSVRLNNLVVLGDFVEGHSAVGVVACFSDMRISMTCHWEMQKRQLTDNQRSRWGYQWVRRHQRAPSYRRASRPFRDAPKLREQDDP
jgi:hypothetical protein